MDEGLEQIKLRVDYIHSLMHYIELEYENIPDQVTEEMAMYFNRCFDMRVCLPNAAGEFADYFLKASS